MKRSFDALIIGAGQAGPPLAQSLAAAGRRVAVVERKLVGGTCVNAGCTPTKAMVASAYSAHKSRTSSEYGVHCGDVSVNLGAVQKRKDAIVAASRTGLESSLENLKDGAFFRGAARFLSPTEMLVGDDILSAPQIFLNVGARPSVPDFPGIGEVPFLTSTTILALKELPEHLIVVGGSYIGLEFGQMFRRFGADVTIVERNPRLIPREDEDVSEAVRDILDREAIDIRFNAGGLLAERRGDDIVLRMTIDGVSSDVIGSHMLLAVGRRPNTDDLGLDKAGVETDAKGYIRVDDRLQTNVPGIFALGDCNGRGAFTHTSYNDFEIVAGNLLDGEDRRLSDRHACYGLFTDPPLGRIGMTEAEARKSGRKVLIGTRPMTRVGRAVEKGETLGFIKILADADTQQILGASMLGVGGDEAVHSLIDGIYAGATLTTLKRAVHIHPTVAELIPTVLGAMKPLQA